MLNVQPRHLGTISLLNIEGQFVVGQTDGLREVMQTLPASGSVILDLSRVTRVDAHGLGVMLELREQAQVTGGELKLMNVSDSLRELLRITRLDSVFHLKHRLEFLPPAAISHWTRIAA
jgi:anti-sigma B factor antagonist